MDFTVIGMYADNQQLWTSHVEEASSPKEAAIKGINNIIEKEHVETEDIFVFEVFEGHITGKLNNIHALCLDNLKEMKK